MFSIPLFVRLARGGEPPQTRAELTVVGWSGMRGGVSLAAELALPLTATEHAFPNRSNVIVIAYIVIVATVVIPGLTLSPLIRRLGLAGEEVLARREARARLAVAHAARGHVEVMGERERLPNKFRTPPGLRTSGGFDRLEAEVDGDAADDDEAAIARRLRELRRELIAVERSRLADLRRRGEILVLSRCGGASKELDLGESRLAQ